MPCFVRIQGCRELQPWAGIGQRLRRLEAAKLGGETKRLNYLETLDYTKTFNYTDFQLHRAFNYTETFNYTGTFNYTETFNYTDTFNSASSTAPAKPLLSVVFWAVSLT